MAKESAEFQKFHVFQKMEEDDDGVSTIWGIATLEQPDLDSEICSYETAVPVYKAWAAASLKRTKGAGQSPSLGPIRVQHSTQMGGKATKLEYKDDAKEIWLGAEPISKEIHDQLKGGFFTGYSQGGSYAWRACAECDGQMPLKQGMNFCEQCDKMVQVVYGLRRLAEVSFVDSPCTGVGFESVKSNGSCSIVKFKKREESDIMKTKRVAGEDLEASAFAYVGDPEKTDTWKLPIKFSSTAKTKRHVRNALARFEQTKDIPEAEKASVKAKIEAAAKEHGIEADGQKSVKVRELIKSHVDTLAVSKGVSADAIKSMYMVSRAADMLESFACLYEQAAWEREIEGDDSEVPDDLKDLIGNFAETFLAMAIEEANELAAQIKGKTSTGEKAMTPEQIAAQQELEKAAKKSLASHFAKAASHHEKMADMHENMAAIHEKADVGCKDCMGKCDTAKAERINAAKADAVAKGEVYKEDVGSGADHDAIHEVIANQQEFHKAMAKENTKKAKMHDKLAEHLGKMAESHDEETAKAVKAEIAAFDAANPEPKVEKTAPITPADPTLEDEIAKAVAAKRKSPEYLKSMEEIADQIIAAEVAKKRETTLAPLGTEVTPAQGQTILKHLNIVPRNDDSKNFAFAGKGDTGNHGGL